ncbi:protein NEDD1 [Tanacetum coccineum]
MKMEILLELTSNKLMVDSILQAGNPVKEILLKLNLPDHMSILTDSKVTPTKHGRMTKPYSSPRFIANCFIADSHKDGHGGFRYFDTVQDGEKRLCLVDDLKHSTKRVRRLDDGSSISIDSNIGMVLIYIELGKFDANSSFNVGVVSSTILKFKVQESIFTINFSTKVSRYICSGGSGQVMRIWDLKRRSLSGDLIIYNLASGARATELKDPNEHYIFWFSDVVDVFLMVRAQVLRVLDYLQTSKHLLVTTGDEGSVHLWDTTGRNPNDANTLGQRGDDDLVKFILSAGSVQKSGSAKGK